MSDSDQLILEHPITLHTKYGDVPILVWHVGAVLATSTPRYVVKLNGKSVELDDVTILVISFIFREHLEDPPRLLQEVIGCIEQAVETRKSVHLDNSRFVRIEGDF